jgi:hypothetical protein
MGTVKLTHLATTYTTEQYALGSKRVQHADEVAANGSGVNTSTLHCCSEADAFWRAYLGLREGGSGNHYCCW